MKVTFSDLVVYKIQHSQSNSYSSRNDFSMERLVGDKRALILIPEAGLRRWSWERAVAVFCCNQDDSAKYLICLFVEGVWLFLDLLEGR